MFGLVTKVKAGTNGGAAMDATARLCFFSCSFGNPHIDDSAASRFGFCALAFRGAVDSTARLWFFHCGSFGNAHTDGPESRLRSAAFFIFILCFFYFYDRSILDAAWMFLR